MRKIKVIFFAPSSSSNYQSHVWTQHLITKGSLDFQDYLNCTFLLTGSKTMNAFKWVYVADKKVNYIVRFFQNATLFFDNSFAHSLLSFVKLHKFVSPEIVFQHF